MSQTVQKIGGSSRFSAIAIKNGIIHLAGQVSQLETAGIAEQAKDVFAKVDALLEQAGSKREDMLSVQIWLADMADYEAMNLEWDAWVSNVTPPTRICVEARMAKPHYKIEVLVVSASA